MNNSTPGFEREKEENSAGEKGHPPSYPADGLAVLGEVGQGGWGMEEEQSGWELGGVHSRPVTSRKMFPRKGRGF